MYGRQFLTIVFGLLLIFAGCLPLPVSIHGLARDANDVVFEPNLEGLWQEDANDPNSTLWKFEFAGDSNKPCYFMEYDEKDKDPAAFMAVVIKIDDQRFLDIYPEDPNYNLSYLTSCSFVKGHVFMKIDQTAPTLQIRMMDNDKVKKLLEEFPQAVRHEVSDDGRIILTAPAHELQEFLRGYQDRIFNDPSNMMRLAEEQQ